MGTPMASKLIEASIVAATVSVLFIGMPSYEHDLTPSEQHSLRSSYNHYGDRWMGKTDMTESVFYSVKIDTNPVDVLQAFGSRLLDSTETLDPKIFEVINKNFSKLF